MGMILLYPNLMDALQKSLQYRNRCPITFISSFDVSPDRIFS